MPENNEVIELDIKSLLMLVLRKVWIIILVAILVAGMAFGYAKLFMTPEYAASVRLYTNNIYEGNAEEIQAGQLTAAAYLAESYTIILYGKPILNEVLQTTGLQDKYTVDQLHSMTTTDTVNQTEIFQVTVTCPDSRDAAILANAFVDVLQKELPDIVNGSDVRLVDYAVESKQVVFPDYNIIIIVAALAGALLSLAVIVLREYLDDSISSEEYLTSVYDEIPLLAVIPDAKEPKNGNYRKYKSYYKRYYRSYYNSGKKNKNGGKAV